MEQLKQEVDKLKQCGEIISQCSNISFLPSHLPFTSMQIKCSADMVELQKAKERNERLDGEIRVLRDRVRSLDTERKTLVELARF